MFIPVFQGGVDLPLDSDSFFQHLERMTRRMGKEGRYAFSRTSPTTVHISSNRLNPFGYTFNDAALVAEPLPGGGIHVRYRVSFIKWFLAMLFLSFQVLIAFAILMFFYVHRLPADVQSTAFVTFFVALTFWALVWPLVMIIIYRVMLSRMFQTLLQSTALFNRFNNGSLKKRHRIGTE
ncbi:MAG: hypothetical protein GXO70_07660 [Acidobacteria bacterium]|nr:hypothetical protein [Acidobacteriota bacterium]